MKKTLFYQLGIVCLTTLSLVSCRKDIQMQTDNKPTVSKSGALRMGIPFENANTEHIGSMLITKTFVKNSAGYIQGVVIAVPDNYDSTSDLLPLIISEGGEGAQQGNGQPFRHASFTADQTHIAQCLNGTFTKRAIVFSFQDNLLSNNNGVMRGFMLDDMLKYLFGLKTLPSTPAVNGIQPNQNVAGLRINRDKVSLWMYSYSGSLRNFWTDTNPATGNKYAADFPAPVPITVVCPYNGLNYDEDLTGNAYKPMGYVLNGRGAGPNCGPPSNFQYGFYNYEERFFNAVKSVEGSAGTKVVGVQLKTLCGEDHGGNGRFISETTDQVLGLSRTGLGLPSANNRGEHIGSMYVTKSFYVNAKGNVQGYVVAIPDNYDSTSDLLPVIISEGAEPSQPNNNTNFDLTKFSNDNTHISQCLAGTFTKRAIVVAIQDNTADQDGSMRGYMLDDLLRYMYGLKTMPASADINNVKANQGLTGLRINKDKVSLWMYGFTGNMKQFWTYNNTATGQPWAAGFPISTPIAAICSYNGLNDGEDNTGVKYKSMGYVFAGRGAGNAQYPTSCTPQTGQQWGFYNYEGNFYTSVKAVEGTAGTVTRGVALQTNCGLGFAGNDIFISTYTDQVLGLSRTGLGLSTAN